MELKDLLFGRKVMTNLDNVLKCRDTSFLTKVCIVKAMVFPVVMYRRESWTIKKAECWRIDVFKLWCWKTLKSPLDSYPISAYLAKEEKTLIKKDKQTKKSSLDSKEIKPVNPKGNKFWIFIGRTDAEAETPILWLPNV